jgi:hypothetical protein
MGVYEQALGDSERAYTSRHPSVFGKRLPDDKLSHLCVVWMRKEISFFDSAVALLRGGHRFERAVLVGFWSPSMGLPSYMSRHLTEHLSALGY